MLEKPTQAVDDGFESKFKERITALIGVGVMVTYGIVAIAAAIVAITGDTNVQSFQNLKDVLTFMSGLVGTVVGYYFGRVGVEKRAEVAESTVQAVQSAMGRAEREAARALGQLDVQKLARDAAEKAKELAEEAQGEAEVLAQKADQAREQVENQIDEMTGDITEVVHGIQNVRERIESFKDKAIGASEAAAEMFGALGAEGEAPPTLSALEVDAMTAELDALQRKAEKWMR